MTIRFTGSEAHLEGNWIHPELVNHINSLDKSLELIESAGTRQLQINCEQINQMDMSGLELLYTWIQCARFRGVEFILVKVPARLKQAMQSLIGVSFTESYPDIQFIAS